MPVLLSVEHLTLARGGRPLVSDLSISVTAGQALVVTGPNGAGKSTLLRALAGLLRPVSGRIAVAGAQIEQDDPVAIHAHYVGHADALKGALTARENLAFWGAALGARAAASGAGASPEAVLERIGLPQVANLPAGWLSAGQKRRVALGRLLMAYRPIWILDEPATALDRAAQQRLAGTMAAHRAGGGLIIAATHAPLGLEDASELRLGDVAENSAGDRP
ncbi:MAG: heme ABC exporter ATP-binding protein CcmA [Beijerinckiaceae bacterium]|nr:heme ABC exporter ATP-binding protein CcmA [Beijerinckiaceae bacterium]